MTTHRESEFIYRIMDRLLKGNTAMLPMDKTVVYDVVDERDRLEKYIKDKMPMQHQIFEKAREAGIDYATALVMALERRDVDYRALLKRVMRLLPPPIAQPLGHFTNAEIMILHTLSKEVEQETIIDVTPKEKKDAEQFEGQSARALHDGNDVRTTEGRSGDETMQQGVRKGNTRRSHKGS